MISHEDVTIQIDGRTITGTYSVRAGMLTVTTVRGNRSMFVSGPGSEGAFMALARDMLRELVLEGKA
jgi:hypothetical protein